MDDLYKINLAKSEYREGFNSGNPDRVLSVVADGFIDMTAEEPSFFGPEAKEVFGSRLRKLFRKYRTELAVVVAEVQLSGNQAVDWGWHYWTLTPEGGGDPITRRQRYIEVWQRQPDESWKIAWFINNADMPPAMPDYLEAQA
ncbi:MAG TPA: nuclear transport factor 2 family protein [Terriglobales bacterium]|jgi:ketosteroid isomerase-like protein|nr:nuclear transport factor 2 family protein [Terriglobales bacterium]